MCGTLFSVLALFPLQVLYFSLVTEGRESEEEKHRCERETLIGCLSYASQPGPNPQPRHVCALTRNQTRDLLVYGTVLQPTGPHQPELFSSSDHLP